MESKKINKDLLLQGLLFALFVVGMVVLEMSIKQPEEMAQPENKGILDTLFFLILLAGTRGKKPIFTEGPYLRSSPLGKRYDWGI